MNSFQVAFIVLIAFVTLGHCQHYDPQYNCKFEDVEPCVWEWNYTVPTGFRLYSGDEAEDYFKHKNPNDKEEYDDGDRHVYGHFLMAELDKGGKEIHVWSPRMYNTLPDCELKASIKMVNMSEGWMRVVVDTVSKTAWVVEEMKGNDDNTWQNFSIRIGKVTQHFRIFLEFAPSKVTTSRVYVDNIELAQCFETHPSKKKCTDDVFKCAPVGAYYKDYCINKTQVCDIVADCLNGADEMQNCERVPKFGRCTFETGWCGWKNEPSAAFNWTITKAVGYGKRYFGPPIDHTFLNESGHFLYANLSNYPDAKLGAAAILVSGIYNPPPRVHSIPTSQFYKSCYIRFNYLQFGVFSGSLALYLNEIRPGNEETMQLWYAYGSSHKVDGWTREAILIPTNVTHKYYFVLEARKGFRASGDISIDDLSMNPECFGINIPEEELEGYDYYNFTGFHPPPPPPPKNVNFANKTSYVFTTCGAEGRYGPTQANCTKAYANTVMKDVTVLTNDSYEGVQRWVVPHTGFYTFVVKGASGGKGYDGLGQSKGTVITAITELQKDEVLYLGVGQKGEDGCRKNLALAEYNYCGPPVPPGVDIIDFVTNMEVLDDGGGGGGASMIFIDDKNGGKVPLIIAGGGGGLGGGNYKDDGRQHGRGVEKLRPGMTTVDSENITAGAGGGWYLNIELPYRDTIGKSLTEGPIGGVSCMGHEGWFAFGGFGGGGGGCQTGGGGGGYIGGSASKSSKNGQGGTSYVAGIFRHIVIIPGSHSGDGDIEIIPALEACGCEHYCAVTDSSRVNVTCLCPEGKELDRKGLKCVDEDSLGPVFSQEFLITLLVVVTLFGCLLPSIIGWRKIGVIIVRWIYKRRRIVLPEFDDAPMPVNRFKMVKNQIMTSLNPNYSRSIVLSYHNTKELREISRDHLRLVNFESPRRPIGHGAFAQVFQGFYKRGNSDSVELPVAVKTLPILSTNQTEIDFIMEAVLMNHFRHPNIVHMIGVCFERQPRFIVLELLAGGDLKNFLRRHRPTEETPTDLVMKDLMVIASDVSKGLEYLHSKHFIHRDLAARNCLLTSNGPGRICKIADFGMARDIYSVSEKAEYLKKQGKALVPVKWMPPESFREGRFTYKCDIWAFGVLLWEIMTFGAMPYAKFSNVKTMAFVLEGGRLERPEHCPDRLYEMMTECWNPEWEHRPSAFRLEEEIAEVLEDPIIMSTPLLPSSQFADDEEEVAMEITNYDLEWPEDMGLTPPKSPRKTGLARALQIFRLPFFRKKRKSKTKTKPKSKSKSRSIWRFRFRRGSPPDTPPQSPPEPPPRPPPRLEPRPQPMPKLKQKPSPQPAHQAKPQEGSQPTPQEMSQSMMVAVPRPVPQPRPRSAPQPKPRTMPQQRTQPAPQPRPQPRTQPRARSTQPTLRRQVAIETTFEDITTTRIVRENFFLGPPPDDRNMRTFTTFRAERQQETCFIEIPIDNEEEEGACGYDPSVYSLPQDPAAYNLSHGSAAYNLPHGSAPYNPPHGPAGYNLPHGHVVYPLPYDPAAYNLPYDPAAYNLPHDPEAYNLPHDPEAFSIPMDSAEIYDPSKYNLPYDPAKYNLPYDPTKYNLPYDPAKYNLPPDPAKYNPPYDPAKYTLPYDPAKYNMPPSPGVATYIEPLDEVQPGTNDSPERRHETVVEIEPPMESMSAAELNKMTRGKPGREVARDDIAIELTNLTPGKKREPSRNETQIPEITVEGEPVVTSPPHTGDTDHKINSGWSEKGSIEDITPENDTDNGEERRQALEPYIIIHERPSKIKKGVNMNPGSLNQNSCVSFPKPKIIIRHVPKEKPGAIFSLSTRLSDVDEDPEM